MLNYVNFYFYDLNAVFSGRFNSAKRSLATRHFERFAGCCDN